MQFNSPLRYPGGKARLSRFVGELLTENDLIGGTYVEPFAGGAGVALSLLYLEYVSRAHLNDLNKSVHAFWWSVLERPEELCRLITDAELNAEEWQRQRDIQRADAPDLLELGFSTLYMNRTNRSGVVKGGMIGGRDQSGPWKLDARFNRRDLINRIQKAAGYRSRIQLTCLDAAELIRTLVPELPSKTLIYLDPPYFKKAEKLYDNHFKKADHAVLAQLVAGIDRPWIVSYDDQPEIRDFYSEFRQEAFKIGYSAGPRAQGTELMIYSDCLKRGSAIRPYRGAAA